LKRSSAQSTANSTRSTATRAPRWQGRSQPRKHAPKVRLCPPGKLAAGAALDGRDAAAAGKRPARDPREPRRSVAGRIARKDGAERQQGRGNVCQQRANGSDEGRAGSPAGWEIPGRLLSITARVFNRSRVDRPRRSSQVMKRPPKRPDRGYPSAKNPEYACVYDWEDRSG
jgi:hypothetical protein